VGPVELLDDDRELEQILALQQENLAATGDGFVTVRHTLETLRAMHAQLPSVVARDERGAVVGYALSMAREAQGLLPILAPMFARLDGLGALAGKRWYVMGQVCVAKAFRGQGVFDALYRGHRERYAGRFDALVTEIATRNGRSMRAHQRVGFTEIDRYRDATDAWSVVGWDF
jgi:L-amino acid N-acyltransferase YncA